MGIWLQFMVYPNAKRVEKAATAGDNRSTGPWSFVNLHGAVKNWKGHIIVLLKALL